jgi:hypothetical protein
MRKICRFLKGRIGMDTLNAALGARVSEVIRAHETEPFLSTMGTRAAIAELINRYEGLEEAVREIALEVEKLATRQ